MSAATCRRLSSDIDRPPTQTRVFDEWEQVRPFREAWNHLVRQSTCNEVFLTFDWLEAWSLAETRPATPHIIVVSRNNVPIGIAPLMFTFRSMGTVTLRTLEFIGSPNSDYSDLIYADEAALDLLWLPIMRAAGSVDTLYLSQIQETSPTCRFLKSRDRVILRPCVVGLSGTLPEDSSAPVNAYLKSGGLRARSLKRIEKEGAVDLQVYTTPDEIRTNLPILFTQHIRRWAETSTPSFFNQQPNQRLYENWAQLQPNVLLSILTLNGHPVASLFGFPYNHKLVVHTLAFDPDYKRFHCGIVGILRLMQQLRSRGIDSIDFTRGTESYKSALADVPLLSYEGVYARTACGKFASASLIAARRMALVHPRIGEMAKRFGFAPSGVDAHARDLLKARPSSQKKIGDKVFIMDNPVELCQRDCSQASSRWCTPLPLYRVFWFVKTEGIIRTAKRTLARFVPGWRMSLLGPVAAARTSIIENDAVNLSPGEWVEIRSENEIAATLDESGRHKGMQFMPQMWRYCGTKARVYKRLETILFEESQQRRKIKSTVLLEGLICDGQGVGCDRSCFYFWREAWLKRVPGQ